MSNEEGTSSQPGKKKERKRPPALEKQDDKKDDSEYDDEDGGDWVPMQSRTQGRPYYYHTESRETSWDMPPDFDDDLPEGAPGWIEMESRSQGRYYYYNQVTRECVWDRPAGVPEPPPFERRRPNPKREALRDIIQDWADEFFKKYEREPTEDDIPKDTDIARHHRDYKMLKQEEEVEVLKKEQTRLRAELNPDSRARLVEIKDQLGDIEPKVDGWKKTKDEERARRERVTSVYNGWIKDFTETHKRGPTEKDIEEGSEIQTMFKEYSKYREEAKRAKARASRIEDNKLRSKHDQEQQTILEYMTEYEKKNGRKPTQKDLPEGSAIAELYKEFIEREMKLNPDSPNSKVEKLRREINEWSSKFEAVHDRKPQRADIKPGTKIGDLCSQYDSLLALRGQKDKGINIADPVPGKKARDAGAREGAGGRAGGGDDWDEMQGQSPRSYAQYQRNTQPGACADCCAVM